MVSVTPEIALVGCPNSGKSALFNALTGSKQKVANYAGVTVERKKGILRASGGARLHIVDLPGTYSLRGRSPDEEVTRDVLLGHLAGEPVPSGLVCVADSTNLRPVLRLILELRRVGLPMVVALNMTDIAERQGTRIHIDRLAQELGVPVVPVVAVRKRGIEKLIRAINDLVQKPATKHEWNEPSSDGIRVACAEVDRILKACMYRPGNDRATRGIDRVLLHPVAGPLILAAILFVVFQAVFVWAAPVTEGIERGVDLLKNAISAQMSEGVLRSLLTGGILAGVGSVVVFLPQILTLFFFIIVLEDSGYMARAAFLMDRLMARVGLHGRAFIPLLSSCACAIPGIMATRVIESKTDRLVTIMVAPLMPCSARILVYALLIAAFIPNASVWGLNLQGLVMFGVYALGAVSALLIAWAMKKFVWRQPAEPFMMEMPGYKWPSLRNIAHGLWQRASVFMRRAGTVIMALMIVIWFLCSFPAPPQGATEPAINYSLAGILGHAVEPILKPIGFNWQIAVALIPGMAAREVAVGALGTVYALSDGAETALQTTLASSWPLSTGLALLAWFIFAPQCVSTLAVVKRETNSWKWPIVMVAYMTTLAYAAAFLTFHVAAWLEQA